NANVRREKGRVFLDKVIDVERANQSEGGRRVLEAIDKGKPVHTSTGLLCNLEAVSGDVDYKFNARNIEFDHDAILLDEEGAATPDQGVGMMVNAAGKEIAVINSTLTEDAERGVDWALDYLAQAMERRERATALEELKAKLSEVFRKFTGSPRATSSTNQENDMTVSKEQFDALSAEVKTLAESLKPENLAAAIGNAVTAAVKPISDHVAELQNAQKAKDEAELEELRGKIVKANLLEEAEAKELTLNAARALAKKAEPGKAAGLNGAFVPTGGAAAFKLPEAN